MALGALSCFKILSVVVRIMQKIMQRDSIKKYLPSIYAPMYYTCFVINKIYILEALKSLRNSGTVCMCPDGTWNTKFNNATTV